MANYIHSYSMPALQHILLTANKNSFSTAHESFKDPCEYHGDNDQFFICALFHHPLHVNVCDPRPEPVNTDLINPAGVVICRL